jgi:hypothetical protein
LQREFEQSWPQHSAMEVLRPFSFVRRHLDPITCRKAI